MARAEIAPEIPEVPWAEWFQQFRGEYRATRDTAQHVTIIGPTNTGKSTLAMQIAALRPYVGVLCAKPRDAHMKSMLRADGYHKAEVLPIAGSGKRRAFVWPPNRGEQDIPRMRAAFASVFDDAFRDGVWHLLVDEAQFVARDLGLHAKIRHAYQMGRSNGHGLIVATQRPAWMPRDIYSSADHLFIFGTNDSEDLKSISGMNGVNDKTIRECVGRLGRDKRFLHVNTVTGSLCVTRYQPRGTK